MLCKRSPTPSCLSVCLSRLYILSKQINISSKFFSPSGSHTILVFHTIVFHLSTGLRSTNTLNKLLSLTYKVLTTSQPSCLNNLISVQPLHSICSSSVVTLSRPTTISSLKITDRFFRYASPRLWNQLSDSFRQPRQSCLDSPPHSLVSLSLLSSPLSSSITPSLFHSRLKTCLFNKSFSP